MGRKQTLCRVPEMGGARTLAIASFPPEQEAERVAGANILAGYSGDAGELVPRYEALRTEDVLAPVMALLPTAPTRILDIGAGTGRDAAWFASHGHDVVAVEPVPEFRRAGMDIHRGAKIRWLDDCLPALGRISAQQATFNLILTIGVWQHLRPGQQPQAMATVGGLVAPSGRLVISIRRGPGAPQRPCFPANVDQIIRWGEEVDLKLLMRREAESIQRENRASGVRWTWLCMERG